MSETLTHKFGGLVARLQSFRNGQSRDEYGLIVSEPRQHISYLLKIGLKPEDLEGDIRLYSRYYVERHNNMVEAGQIEGPPKVQKDFMVEFQESYRKAYDLRRAGLLRIFFD